MPDPLKKAKTGDPLQIPSRTWNDLLDMLLWYKREQQARAGSPPPDVFSPTVGLVQNGTSSPLPRFSVLSVGNPIITPANNANGFAARVALTGSTPAFASGDSGPAHNAGNFVITLEPIGVSAIGRCVLSGDCPCYLDVGDTSDGFADLEPGSSLCLKTGGTGGAQIIWKDGTAASPQPSGAPATLYWAIVRIGSPGGLPPGGLQYQCLQRPDDTGTTAVWGYVRAHDNTP